MSSMGGGDSPPSWLQGINIPATRLVRQDFQTITHDFQLAQARGTISTLRQDLSNTQTQLNTALDQIQVERRRITLSPSDIHALTDHELNDIYSSAHTVALHVNAEINRRHMQSAFLDFRRMSSTPQQAAPMAPSLTTTNTPTGLYCPICRGFVVLENMRIMSCGHVCCVQCRAHMRGINRQSCHVCRTRTRGSPIRIFTDVGQIEPNSDDE